MQIKVFGSRIKVDSVAKVAELEQAEKDKMKEKVCYSLNGKN
jgi:T-complex protein 1 subunit beta